MQPSMVSIVAHLTTACQVRHLRISVPLVPCLIDGVRYFLPDILPAPVGEELRALYRPRLTPAAGQRAEPEMSEMLTNKACL